MRVAITTTQWVEIGKAAWRRITKAEQENLCVACLKPLGNQKPIRGCHPACHRATLRAIEAGKLSEVQRIEAGQFLPRGTPGRKPSNPVSVEATQ